MKSFKNLRILEQRIEPNCEKNSNRSSQLWHIGLKILQQWLRSLQDVKVIRGLAQWVKGSSVAAAAAYVTAAAHIQSLAGEFPYAKVAAIKIITIQINQGKISNS